MQHHFQGVTATTVEELGSASTVLIDEIAVLITICHAGMVAASLASLSGAGSFIEVGKRDIWSPQRAAQERPDVTYKLIAIDFWEPQVVGSSLQRLAGMLATGELYSLARQSPECRENI